MSMESPVRASRPSEVHPSPPLSASGRPKRTASVGVNYADAVEDTPMRAGSGSSKKRIASQSPARKVRTLNSVIRDIQARAMAEKEEEEAKGKAKPTSLNFGASKPKEAGRSPIFVTRFVVSCEQVCSRSPELLAAYHKEVAKLLPVVPAEWDRIRAAMEKVLTKRVVERIEAQMDRLGPNGAPRDVYLHKSARTPMLSECSKCKSKGSYLVTICSSCKQHKPNTLTLLPYLDWREARLKQQELDEFDATINAASAGRDGAKTPTGSAKKKAGVKSSPSKSSPSDDSAMEDIHGRSSPEEESKEDRDAVHSTPNKRAKTSAAASPTTPSTVATPSKMKSSEALSAVDMPDAAWISQAREEITLRAIQWLRVCMAKARPHEFHFHGGDIIFLLRNAIFKGRGRVAEQANIVVREMIARWDSTTLTIISDSSEPAHILVYSECLHAKKEMKCGTEQQIAELCSRVSSALTNHCAEDILRFDASLYQHHLPTQAYCHPCGVFHASSGKSGSCPECSSPLRQETDFEFLCESLVWTSLFRELGIEPVRTADAAVGLGDILALMKHIRPYGSLEERGADSFKLQCYFITHLTFVLTRWGAVAMTPRPLFVEEYLFLLANMDVVIKIKDPELVGEFLQAMHILDTPHEHPAMQKGYHFLLTHEKKGKMRGNWMAHSEEFYKKYHTAYCGIIGMAEFEFDRDVKFNTEWDHYFQ